MADTLGFIGLGHMGKPMATRLIQAGHDLVVLDTDAAAMAALVALGAKSAASPQAVADAADIVIVSLPTPAVVQTVALGETGVVHGKRARMFVDLSTTGPRVAASVAEQLRQAGRITPVDSPVSGGVTGAEKGTLAVMVSCPRATYDALTPVLQTFGKLFFCGEAPGLAQSMKLANNLLSVAGLVAAAEVMAMGVKSGLDPQVMIDVINVSSGRNTAIADKFPRAVLTGTFDFGFATGLSHKDVRLCVDEAEAIGVPMVVGAAVRQMMTVTEALYGADSDFTNVARVLETWAGVEIRSRK
jgi:3-hydroxyisobutyrate dehydrogenase-like beta-hydroxyacid dehydrogenase